MKTYNTEEQEAERIGFAPKTLANQRCRGDGPPFIKVGRLVRYDPELTDAWLADRIRNSTSEAA
ncbi:helix-turn-helix transcriptional regulator [Croceicoccus bisphenolivorans]|uniref:helix-turn-helix transcriptional regulator n=1 Tax=Croceicoccus bisphenolivorans TaxID=1783232 RepID=UPI000AD0A743|nr:DNA-binding protein [Croceicoccus bisphenolivorans]